MGIAEMYALLPLLVALLVAPSAQGAGVVTQYQILNATNVNNETLRNLTNGTVLSQAQAVIPAVVSAGQNVSNATIPSPVITTPLANTSAGNSTSGGDSGGLDPMWYYIIPSIVVVVAVSIGLGVYFGMHAKGYVKLKSSPPGPDVEHDHKVLRLSLVRHVHGSDMT